MSAMPSHLSVYRSLFVQVQGVLPMHFAAILGSVTVVSSLWGRMAEPQGCPSCVVPITEAAYEIAGAPRSGALVTAFLNVNVVPMDRERVLAHQTVLIAGGRIAALGPANQVKVPAGAVRIDGSGKYLIPGLGDMHTHVAYARSDQWSDLKPELPYDSAAAYVLFYWLANGITTIRNLDFTDVDVEPEQSYLPSAGSLLRLRARAAAGEILSPRIYVSGAWAKRNLSGWEPRSQQAKPEYPIALDSVAVYVAAYKAAGYDHLKVRVEPAVIVDSVLAAAGRVGLPVVGHLVSNLPLERVFAGYRSIEHMYLYPDDTSNHRSLATTIQRAGIWITPTMAVGGASPALLKVLQDAGAGLLLGSDMTMRIGSDSAYGIHRELRAMVQFGLTPYQALVTGTRNVAQYFGLLDSSGTVMMGKRADLVLLRGNPLADIRYTAHPAGVMLGGRWLARDEIDQRFAVIRGSGAIRRSEKPYCSLDHPMGPMFC